jgi:zinc protease
MSQALSSASSHGDWRLLFIQRDRVAAVHASDVNRVAKAYFQKPNRTVGLYIPARESQRLDRFIAAKTKWSIWIWVFSTS